MKKRHVIWVAVGAVAAILAVAGGWLWLSRLKPSPLSADLRSQITFDVFLPQAETIVFVKDSATYNGPNHTLTFKANMTSPLNKFVITEQPAPSTHDEAASDLFMTNLRKVSASHDAQMKLGDAIIFNGSSKTTGRTAVLVAGTTIIYVNASQEMLDAGWRALFDTFKLSTP